MLLKKRVFYTFHLSIKQKKEKMKYTIQRQFSFGNQEFEVTRNSKTVSVIKVKPSKQYKDQFT